ncbi:MAG: glycosyltransferase family 4 protein [Phycisphaerae bacterium]|nr:glycosyltransferase family 4 protein [Phycisphaerae bacterium]
MLSAIVSHSGKQHAYWHARAMERLGGLHHFITSSYYAPQRWPDRLLSRWAAADRYLRRRCLDGLDARVIRQPLFELPEVMCRAAMGNGRLVRDLILQRDALFDRWVASTLSARGGADTFWGFQGSCCQSLTAARRVGLTAVVELATGHAPAAEAILGRERQRHPEWADSLSNDAFPRWYGRRLDDEVIRADYCVVASTFTRQTLERSGVEDARILTLPLGADLRRFTFSRRSSTGPFQILFVGGVGQRKGIKYLLDAYDRIRGNGIRLVVVGPLVGSGRAFRARMRGVEYVGRADQAAVVDHMRKSHVLVLPSLFEGFGLVIPEAMATGMPVIASTHSAAPDILREGRDGFVLAPDDVDGLAEALTRLATHRRDAVAMGAEAATRAAEFGWDRHTERLADVCRTIEAGRNDSVVRAAAWAGGLN